MFIPLISRGTGILIPFYLGACGWLVQVWYPVDDDYPPGYIAQMFLLGAIVAFVHAFILLRNSRMNRGHGAAQPDTIWSNTFFGLPVIFWSVAFLGISIWQFSVSP